MTKHVLMIAYHFPPLRKSSGIQRTLKFATYLQDHDWQPIILSVHPRAYDTTGQDQLRDIPKDVVVRRAFALDATRHLSIKGRYPLFVALPDRYSSWILGAVPAGIRLIRKHKPDVIWSTYPIATSLVIGYLLKKATSLPWVADFRDSMTEEQYPKDPKQRRIYRKIERMVIATADKIVFTTEGTRQMYAERYPDVDADRWQVIPNGYDEAIFKDVETLDKPARADDDKIRLVHSGVIYQEERDPRPFFDALSRLKKKRRISADSLEVILRATGHDHVYAPMLVEKDIEDIVHLAESVAYREAIQEMQSSDGLLLFQSSGCNHQIPAKLYEYFRARKPVFAMTDAGGNTADTLREAGIDTIAPLDDAEKIHDKLIEFLDQLGDKSAPVASENSVEKYSRQSLTGSLAKILNQLT